jgi:hypothetical protein
MGKWFGEFLDAWMSAHFLNALIHKSLGLVIWLKMGERPRGHRFQKRGGPHNSMWRRFFLRWFGMG